MDKTSWGYSTGDIFITIHIINLYTVCPGSSDPFYIVTYYINWVTTSWTHGIAQ